jgi:hypothetical protein
MTRSVYIETSVVSYLASHPSRDLIVAANQRITQDWWQMRRSDFDLYISQLVVQEAAVGDQDAVQRRLQVIDELPLLELNEQALNLGRMLVDDGPIPRRAAEDALHVSIATVHGMDYLLTWNFRHLANATMRYRIELACRARGYEPPIICTPQELLEE